MKAQNIGSSAAIHVNSQEELMQVGVVCLVPQYSSMVVVVVVVGVGVEVEVVVVVGVEVVAKPLV